MQACTWAPPEDAWLKHAVLRWSIAMVYGQKAHLWQQRDLTEDLKVRMDRWQAMTQVPLQNKGVLHAQQLQSSNMWGHAQCMYSYDCHLCHQWYMMSGHNRPGACMRE
jgi:hypothetical protein